ncbi:MAG: hypothetical protein K5Q00_01240, partial [Gammaproteobacteria bacterium]|nr:hypothetical protein [Gammaproteobacteria bacterium]
MIIYSRIDDTPDILTTDYLGYYDADYAKQIRERNQYALGWHLLNESGYYAENWPLWLPDKVDEVDPETSLAIVKRLEWGRSYQRRALAQAQWAGIDIYDLLGVHHLLLRANGLAQRENLLQGTTDFGWLSVANTVGLTHRHYDVFDTHITKFNADAADYFNASDADKPRLLKNLESQRTEISRLFKDQLKAFKLYNKDSLFKEKLTAANTDALNAWDV